MHNRCVYLVQLYVLLRDGFEECFIAASLLSQSTVFQLCQSTEKPFRSVCIQISSRPFTCTVYTYFIFSRGISLKHYMSSSAQGLICKQNRAVLNGAIRLVTCYFNFQFHTLTSKLKSTQR